jgi:hypothetical protein
MTLDKNSGNSRLAASLPILPFLLYAIVWMSQLACMTSGAPQAPGGLAASPAPPGPGAPETEALLKRLTALAESSADNDQKELARLLAQASTLERLDEPKERSQRTPPDFRVARVFDRLRANPSPAAASTLSTLMRSEALNSDWRLQELLIRALGIQRPLRDDSVHFLDAQSQSESLNLQIVIIALIENQSPPAMALLGRKLEDPKLDANNKISWIRYRLLPVRRSPELLSGVEKWLAAGKLDAIVRNALVDALFDYRPREWGGTELPVPPDEAATSAEAAVLLRRIGKMVTSSDYPSSIKDGVRRTLAKLP